MHTWTPPWFWLLAALMIWGCAGAGVVEKSPADEVKAFFAAGNEANFLGLVCSPSRTVDLSAYTSYTGVKYPPTASVEVLSGPPSRPYQAFAVLQCAAAASPTPTVLAQFTAKAKAIGADAIILCPAGDGSGRQDAARPAKAEAVAIKYRVEKPGGK